MVYFTTLLLFLLFCYVCVGWMLDSPEAVYMLFIYMELNYSPLYIILSKRNFDLSFAFFILFVCCFDSFPPYFHYNKSYKKLEF